MAFIDLNLSNVQAQESIEPVPPGLYHVSVEDTDFAFAKSSGAPMLKITFNIEDGDFAGRKLFDNYMLNHEVGMKRLKALAVASNHPNPSYIADSEEFHGLECLAKVKLETDPEGKYDPKNKISYFKPVKAGKPAAPAFPAAAPVAPPMAPAPAPIPVAPQPAAAPLPSAPQFAPPPAPPVSPAAAPVAPVVAPPAASPAVPIAPAPVAPQPPTPVAPAQVPQPEAPAAAAPWD